MRHATRRQPRIRTGGITVPSTITALDKLSGTARSAGRAATGKRGPDHGRRQAADPARRRRPGRGQLQDGVPGGERGGRGVARAHRAGPAGRRRAGLPAERRRPRPAPRRRPHGVDRAAARRRRRPVLARRSCARCRTSPWPAGWSCSLRASTATPSGSGRWSAAFAARRDRRTDPRPAGRRPVVPRARGGLGHGGGLRRPGAARGSTSTPSWRPTPPARRRAVRHLAAHGHTRIAFLGDRADAGDAPRRLPGRAGGRRARPGPGAGGRRPRRTPRSPSRGGRAVPHGRPADGAVHRAGRRDGRGAARAAPARACSGSSRWSGSATSSPRTCSPRASPSSPRTPPASADGPRTCCSPGWRARPGRRRPTTSRRC